MIASKAAADAIANGYQDDLNTAGSGREWCRWEEWQKESRICVALIDTTLASVSDKTSY